jgi:hypothetical protein
MSNEIIVLPKKKFKKKSSLIQGGSPYVQEGQSYNSLSACMPGRSPF